MAVLASHTGSNLQALIDDARSQGSGYEIALVISNNRQAAALERAEAQGIPAFHLSRQVHPDAQHLDAATVALLEDHQIDLIVTAGYLRKLGPATLGAFHHRIINIHPSLLPRHGGQGMYGEAVHAAVLAAGDSFSGASVHLVTAEYDEGPVIARREVPVLAGDTIDTLATRVLRAEHELLPVTVRALAVQRSEAGNSFDAGA